MDNGHSHLIMRKKATRGWSCLQAATSSYKASSFLTSSPIMHTFHAHPLDRFFGPIHLALEIEIKIKSTRFMYGDPIQIRRPCIHVLPKVRAPGARGCGTTWIHRQTAGEGPQYTDDPSNSLYCSVACFLPVKKSNIWGNISLLRFHAKNKCFSLKWNLWNGNHPPHIKIDENFWSAYKMY